MLLPLFIWSYITSTLAFSEELVTQQSQLIQHPSDLTVGLYTSDSQGWSAGEWKQEIERFVKSTYTTSIFDSL